MCCYYGPKWNSLPCFSVFLCGLWNSSYLNWEGNAVKSISSQQVLAQMSHGCANTCCVRLPFPSLSLSLSPFFPSPDCFLSISLCLSFSVFASIFTSFSQALPHISFSRPKRAEIQLLQKRGRVWGWVGGVAIDTEDLPKEFSKKMATILTLWGDTGADLYSLNFDTCRMRL